MLLEIAIGDAYGAGFEFSSREKIDSGNTLSSYVPHDRGLIPGHYTDDTQMSIAVSEVLLSGTRPSRAAFAEAFVGAYKRDPRKGYARGLQSLLDECANGNELLERIRPNSRRNGAAMRSVPLGLVADLRATRAIARDQAAITHDTPEGLLSSEAVALMAHELLYARAPLASLPSRLHEELEFAPALDWAAEVECDAIQTLHAVSTALLRNRRLSSLLRDCVEFGGDVDSVAAIALGLASLSPEYIKDIPERLQDDLENADYGKAFLARTDEALANRFPVLLDRLR